MDFYLIFIWKDVQPKIFGPFKNAKARDKKAIRLRNDYGEYCGYFPVEITKGSKIEVDCYPNSFWGIPEINK